MSDDVNMASIGGMVPQQADSPQRGVSIWT